MMSFVCQTKNSRRGAVDCPQARQKDAPVDIASRFGENLTRCRKRADLSQEELAVRASLHRTEIGHLERGMRLARVDTIVKLAGALSIAPSDLLEGMSWTPGITTSGQFDVGAAAEPEKAGGPQAGPSLAPAKSA